MDAFPGATMLKPFFPDPTFGWIFYGVLMALLVLAAIYDFRFAKVPKRLAGAVLIVGVILNMVRGGMLASAGREVWILGQTGPVLGALDGFLFALIGFVAGFGLFFVMWILGACGGGDVKLFAALGTWIGPTVIMLMVLALAVAVLILLGAVSMVISAMTQGVQATRKAYSAYRRPGEGPRKTYRFLTYSFSLAVAVSLVLLWAHRFDLKLATPVMEDLSGPVGKSAQLRLASIPGG